MFIGEPGGSNRSRVSNTSRVSNRSRGSDTIVLIEVVGFYYRKYGMSLQQSSTWHSRWAIKAN